MHCAFDNRPCLVCIYKLGAHGTLTCEEDRSSWQGILTTALEHVSRLVPRAAVSHSLTEALGSDLGGP